VPAFHDANHHPKRKIGQAFFDVFCSFFLSELPISAYMVKIFANAD